MKIKYCNSWISKAIGLMFSFRPKILVFSFKKEKFIPLHMFFVFRTIDVLFLDSKKKIVEKATLRPFSVYIPIHKAKYVIEMPHGYKKKINF